MRLLKTIFAMRFLLTIVVFIVLVFITRRCSFYSPIERYRVEMTYVTGERDTLIMFANQAPYVEPNGCVYDYGSRTRICGVRKVSVVVEHPHKVKPLLAD